MMLTMEQRRHRAECFMRRKKSSMLSAEDRIQSLEEYLATTSIPQGYDGAPLTKLEMGAGIVVIVCVGLFTFFSSRG
jgi:hypothetical protein